MAPFWSRRVAGVLVLALLAGGLAMLAAPDDARVVGLWPVGLAAGALLTVRRTAQAPGARRDPDDLDAHRSAG